MKKCPFCAEEIQDEAVKCCFCGEYLKKKEKWKGCLIGCLVAFAVAVLLFILFTYLGFLFLKCIFNKFCFWTFKMPQRHYYPPFFGGGIEGMLSDFAEAFKALWERLRDFFYSGSGNQRFTF